jgi:hypothetical protein
MDARSVESNNTRSMFSRKKIKVHIHVQREAIKYRRVFIRKQILPLEQKHVTVLHRQKLTVLGGPRKIAKDLTHYSR